MKGSTNHWNHAGLTFLLTVLAGGVLLPLVRSYPRAAHDFIIGLSDWLRIGFIFFLSTLFALTMFKLLSPRLGHLRHWKSHPPAWLAALLGLILVAVLDISDWIYPEGYRATVWEWLGYGGGSVLIAGWYCDTWQEATKWFRKSNEPTTEETLRLKLWNIADASWEDIQEWLRSDAPAHYDFLGNRSVADRLAMLLISGTRSVGVIGPFGAGKTSLVHWIVEKIDRSTSPSKRFFVCHHSCWGFEDSASAIHTMLAVAVVKIGAEIDTFQVDSLPESYRQTFSAGGDWINSISKLILKTPDPLDQFERLSRLLGDLNARLIFIVEDLDRNETRSFEIQEVLAFLERLKPYGNFSFVLTGGLFSSNDIDFAKLCDHIENLRSINPQHSSALVLQLRQRCLDPNVFPHIPLGDTDQQDKWNPLTELLMRDYEELSFSQAVASLLNTPRSLRHTLGRTLSSWRMLCGEIDFDQLLAVNVLRFGAPECFLFLVRRWDRLHSPPSERPQFGKDRVDRIRKAVSDDWNQTILNVEWSPTAALKIVESILPATEYWLGSDARFDYLRGTTQGVTQERYWLRAVNDAIADDDVRDQEILGDIHRWLASPSIDAELITKLIESSEYSDIWEQLAGPLFADQADTILLLCEHVLRTIMERHGPAASHDSQGFVHTWRFAHRRVASRPENREWLEARMMEASATSIELVNGLWHYYGNPGRYSIVGSEDGAMVRQLVLSQLKQTLIEMGMTECSTQSSCIWNDLPVGV